MKLHLGCDKRYIPGFVHIDLADYPHIDFRHDIRSLPMIADNSVDLIYVCHALEYFDRTEVVGILEEWVQKLRPDGILRIAVPDFEALAKVYQISRDLGKVLGPLFGRWAVPGAGVTLFHRTVYDFEALSTVLRTVGLRDCRRYEWRDTIHKDYDDYSQAYYPHMDKEKGILISLNIEANKPG
jgi:predicted SAM-dependent methyltransferase